MEIEQEFNKWLRKTVETFTLELSDWQKCYTLDSLIHVCGPTQLRHLSNKLECFIRRDFLKCLPLELSYYLITWLDVKTVCTCCLVSQHWNSIINSCDQVWLKACKSLGLQISNKEVRDENAQFWKTTYKRCLKRLQFLEKGLAFSFGVLRGHTARVTALFQSNGRLASGGDDLCVRVWNIHSGECVKVIQTHSCADLKFYQLKLVTGSFNCTVGLWDMETGCNIRTYVGHTGAVLSIDFDESAGVLVSGSADKTVKIWSMDCDRLQCTFHGHQDWVKKVLLGKCSSDAVTHHQGDLVLLTMDAHNIKIWPISSKKTKCLGTLHLPTADTAPKHPLLLHLQFDGTNVSCSSQSGIHIWNFQTLQYLRFLARPVQVLLGCGSMCTLVIYDETLIIQKTNNNQVLSAWKHPSVRFSGRSSSCVMGNRLWLDGWRSAPENGLVVATSQSDHSICLVKWTTDFKIA